MPYFFLLGKGESVGSGWEGCLSTGKYTKVHMMFRKRFTPYLLDTLPPPPSSLILLEVLLTRRHRIYLTKIFGVHTAATAAAQIENPMFVATFWT